MFSLKLHGFTSKAQVEAFIDWYSGAGEQDAQVWFECRMDEGEIDIDFMPVDNQQPYVWDGDTLHARLDIDNK